MYAVTTDGMEANGGLQCANNKCLRPECLVEAAAKDFEGFKRFEGLEKGMYTQRPGCNAGTAKADGQRAWWQLPRGIWRVLRVLRV